jgi:hypothetical protein
MREIVAAEYLALDGVMEGPGPAGDFEHRGWTVPSMVRRRLIDPLWPIT